MSDSEEASEVEVMVMCCDECYALETDTDPNAPKVFQCTRCSGISCSNCGEEPLCSDCVPMAATDG